MPAHLQAAVHLNIHVNQAPGGSFMRVWNKATLAESHVVPGAMVASSQQHDLRTAGASSTEHVQRFGAHQKTQLEILTYLCGPMCQAWQA